MCQNLNHKLFCESSLQTNLFWGAHFRISSKALTFGNLSNLDLSKRVLENKPSKKKHSNQRTHPVKQSVVVRWQFWFQVFVHLGVFVSLFLNQNNF